MIVVDTNVLLTAFRAELPNHAVSRNWLQKQLQLDIRLCAPNVVQVSFLRLATRSLGPLPAAPLVAATTFLSALGPIDVPEVNDLRSRVLTLCARFGLAGDGTVDAWIAATAIALEAPLATFDRGFSKYAPELQLLNL